MSTITMNTTETEAPGPLSYTLAPTDINYSVDRCRGRLFRDEDYDIRWTPPVGRESQCAGRVAEDSLCSRCLHNLARWRESCGTAAVRGGDQDWWGRVDDPMPARAPTLAGKGWVAEKNPGWNTDTVESLTATLAALTAEYWQIDFDYDCLVQDEDEWPRESDDLDEQFRAEQAALRRLNKAIKDGVILPPAAPAPAPPAAETVGSLRVKVAEMRKKRDDWKRCLDELLAEGWLISKRVRKAFADVREKTAVAREHLALRAENAALKATAAAAAVPADMTAENAALRARIAALEEELADADSLSKSLRTELDAEIQRANEIGDSARRAFEERMVGVREEAARACREAADFKAQFEEADFHRRAFEKAHEEAGAAYCSHVAELTRQLGNLEENYEFSTECNARLRAELEEAFAAKRQFSEDIGAALKRAAEAEESAVLVSSSNAELQRQCDDLAETIAMMGQTIDGLRRGLDEAASAKLRFSDDFAAAQADAAKYRELFNRLNDRLWAYGGTLASLRRRIEASEPLRRITELEEQVAALREKNAEVTRSLHFEVGHAIKWQNRAYAAEKPAVGATEVHELRAQLVAQKELIRERDEARAEIEALKAAAAEDRQSMVHWMERGEAAEKMLTEQRAALEQSAVQHGEMTREIERLRSEVTALEERAAVADHEADEAHEESADFQRALAHEGDREEELEAERYRWQGRYKDLRRLIAETLAEVEPILEREETMPAGVALRALSLLK